MASEQAKGLAQLWQRLTELRDLRYGDHTALASWQAKARTDLQRILPDRDDAARLERIWSSRHTAAAARRLLASDFESQRRFHRSASRRDPRSTGALGKTPPGLKRQARDPHDKRPRAAAPALCLVGSIVRGFAATMLGSTFMAYRYVYCRFCGAKLAGLGSEMESGRCLHCLASSGLRLLPSERQRLREETADWDPQRVARRCRCCHALLSLYNLDNYCEACLTKIREGDIHRGAKRP